MDFKLVGANVRRRRKELRLTLPELAELSGVDKGNLSKLENGTRGVSLSALARLAAALKTNIDSLTDKVGNVSPVATEPMRLPVISWREVGETRGISGFRDGPMHEYALFNITASTETFALRIEDESMAPRFQLGDIIAVDPKGAPYPGAYVIAKVGDVAMLRQYRELGRDKKGRPVFELVPLNPLYGPRRSDQEKILICGIATQLLQNL